VIEVRGLRMTYGDVEAVRGVDLHVDAGEVVALLGPNGAGKTTTVEILEGFRMRTAGEASVPAPTPGDPPPGRRVEKCTSTVHFSTRGARGLPRGGEVPLASLTAAVGVRRLKNT
jgi:ABC-type branched-subunit amino acid transport system ATPase component